MKTNEIREKYLDFFASKGCIRRPSDVLVPKDDPTVLFTPAGMNQFKEQFLGVGQLEFTKATTCQKCLRTGDISNVGVTAYHHTFFEMLGNFSFGDYFKREAIHWAWEFLTSDKWMHLPAEKLSVSVYRDENDDKNSDDEAYKIWHDEIGIPESRIEWLGEHDNFWPAGAPTDGPDGVCGPCSEIFFHPGGNHKEVEIWNLVFTQYNRVGNPPNNLKPLPAKNIDTGMGLERMAAVMQGVTSNFEIDTLRPLCEAAGNAVGVKYDFDSSEGRALRRIADHVRAVTFCVHEGVQPGNKEESSVVRQLLRRAVLEGYLLGKNETFLHTLVPAVVEVMKQPYPEIAETVETVQGVIEAEESQFLEVVDRGLEKFDECVEKARASGESQISGKDAFELHTTHGFLIEITQAMAAKHSLKVDLNSFEKLIDEFGEVSRGGKEYGVMAEGPLDAIRKTHGGTEFLGYKTITTEANIIGILAEKQLVETLEEVGHDDLVAVILDRSPFYGEAGGQVGDTGQLKGDGFTFDVTDTQRYGDLILHIGHLSEGRMEINKPVQANVVSDRRAGIRRAHSATHLLHHALHSVIGDQATQRGSKVEDDVLRFDFAHRKALASDEVNQIEDVINTRIAEGAVVETSVMNIDDARKAGAMALFGEKYPDNVRVVKMGDFSTELCGGTHLTNTGQVGLCRVISEEPVAKGVRRIIALTGPKALERVRHAEELLGELQRQLKTPQPDDLPKRIESMQIELRDLKKELAKHSARNVAGQIDELVAQAEVVDGVHVITHSPENATRESLREYVDQIRAKVPAAVILLGAEVDGKVALIAAVSKDLISRGVKAGDCVKVAAREVGGGGGGRPDMAEAGGKQPENIPQALQAGVEYFKSQLSG